MKCETIEHLKDTDFKRLTGVQRETFDLLLQVVEKGLRNFGRPSKLRRADQLLMTLIYWREYWTEFHIAHSYGISEATVCRTIQKVEDAFVWSGEFRLPGRKALQAIDSVFEVMLVDVSEQPIERPKKGKNGITVSKRRAQVMADRKSAQIVATAFSYGSKHDFQLFKDAGGDYAEPLVSWQNFMKTPDAFQEIQVSLSDEKRETVQSCLGSETNCD